MWKVTVMRLSISSTLSVLLPFVLYEFALVFCLVSILVPVKNKLHKKWIFHLLLPCVKNNNFFRTL